MRLSSDHEKDLLARTLKFAVRVVRLCAALPKNMEGRIFSGQLLRAGTSVGAHLAEAAFAKSRPDFCSKIDGALQELEESRYWMDLLIEAGFVSATKLRLLKSESDELRAILLTIAQRSRAREKSKA